MPTKQKCNREARNSLAEPESTSVSDQHPEDVVALDSLVDVKTAAQSLGISASLLYAYVERKQIPHYRLGRAIRFRRSELEAWLGRFRVSGGIDNE